MPKMCCVPVCISKSSKCTMHRFPKPNTIQYRQWIENIFHSNVPPNFDQRAHYVCRQHFDRSCYNGTMDKAYINRDAIPTLHLKVNVNADNDTEPIYSQESDTQTSDYETFEQTPKRKKRFTKVEPETSSESGAMALFNKERKAQMDENDTFGKSVASQLGSIPDKLVRAIVRLEIQKVFFNAETGKYDQGKYDANNF